MKEEGDKMCDSNGFITVALLCLTRGNTALHLNNLKTGKIIITHRANIGPCILSFMVTLSLYFIFKYRILRNTPV